MLNLTTLRESAPCPVRELTLACSSLTFSDEKWSDTLDDLSQRLKELLDSQGVKGRYVLERQVPVRQAVGGEDACFERPGIKLYTNSEKVLRLARDAGWQEQDCGGKMVGGSQAARFMYYQCWEAMQLAMSVVADLVRGGSRISMIDCRLKDPNYCCVHYQATNSPDVRDEARTRLVDSVADHRREVVRSVQKHLHDCGLSRKFVIPQSHLIGGTHDRLRIVGTAAVRVNLMALPDVIVEEPMRSSKKR